jgi:hypothetical protein
MNFYDEVLLELMVALGGALFVANAYALARRRSDAEEAAASPRTRRSSTGDTDLAQAPVARSVTYMLIGLVVAIWGIASLIVK